MVVIIFAFFDIFTKPSRRFETIKNKPRWVVIFAIIVVLSILFDYLMLPFIRQVILKQLTIQLGEQKAQFMFALIQRYQYQGLLFVPIPLLIKWFLYTVTLYFLSVLFNAPRSNFKTIFSVIVNAEMILILMALINLFILYIRGLYSVQSITDLQAIVGLDYFLADKAHNIPLFTFLSNFNVFTMWYVVVLTIGVAVVTGLEKWKSAIIVSLVWLFGVGIQVAFATLASNMQQMMMR